MSLLLATRRHKREALAGKLVVITGGSRGLGLALSEACLKAGARVAMLARDLEELERGRARLLQAGFPEAAINLFQCDVTQEEQVQRAAKAILANVGSIDILINNAGMISVGPIQNQSLASFHESMDTNFFGALHCTLAVLPGMLQRGTGQIVNIASIGGLIPVPHLLPYSASKFALVGFSRGLAVELRPKGIHVLTVCPWLMRTGSHLQALFSGQASKEYRWFSMGAVLPLISVGARVAAGRIIAAIESHRSELLVSAWSVLASRVASNAPATTSLLLTVADSLALPAGTEGDVATQKGFMARQKELKLVDRIGTQLAKEWNQTPG